MPETIREILADPEFKRIASQGFQEDVWKAYLAESESRERVLQARFIFESSGLFPKEQLSEKQESELWERIDSATNNAGQRTTVYRYIRWAGWAAAMVICLLGVFLLEKGFRGDPAITDTTSYTEEKLISVTNDNSNGLPLELPDGSTAVLTPRSKLSYREDLYNKSGIREVRLEGEAFFEVVSDPERPFYVLANELVTRVVGTSFNVKAFPEEDVAEVVVHTGKVKVFLSGSAESRQQAEDKAKTLKAFDRAVLDRLSHSIKSERVIPEIIMEEVFDYNLDDTPVLKVFAALERQYGVKIQYPESVLSECRITADLSDESFYEKIRLICLGLNASYELVDGEVVVTSDGCQ